MQLESLTHQNDFSINNFNYIIFYYCFCYLDSREHAPLAQLVEHRTFNPCVSGSSPEGRTMTILKKNNTKCSALTSANKPCLRIAISCGLFCRVHQGKKTYDRK